MMVMLLVVMLVFLFIPIVRTLPIIIILMMVGVWRYMVYQARNVQYGEAKLPFMKLFHGVGDRFV